MSWIILLVAIGTALAADDALAGAKKDPPPWVPPTHIQMLPMMLPAGGTRVPITFYLEATEPEKAEAICKHMPRVRDAVLLAVSRQPIPVKNRRLILKGLDQRMLKPINRAVGKPLVKRVFVAKGVVQMGTGKIKYRPFAVIDGCVNVLRSEREREQAARAAGR